MEQPLRLGAAYHGNRMLHHAQEDLRDMMQSGLDLVVHMLSHTDWERHLQRMRDIVTMTTDFGMDSWIDNWGLGGPPGDVSHFLAYHPEAHMIYSDGSVDPKRVCLYSEVFRGFMHEWIDAVVYTGAKSIFWDEPHIPLRPDGVYACACPACRERFRAQYGYDMPKLADDNVRAFRLASINDYFREMTAYSHEKGLYNSVCVMLGEQHGISLKTLGAICDVPTLDNIGSDPYWLGANPKSVYEYVYTNTKENLRVSDHFGKDHNVWIQTYSNPRGREEEIIEATEAAYDAGARTILCWGYYGSESNDYAAKNPERTWQYTRDAFRRIREQDRDARLAENRRLYRK